MRPAPEGLRRELGLRDLVLFNVAAVLGMRWLAAGAHAGPAAVGVWIGAAAFFFIPSALAVASLSRTYPAEGGLYVWARESFGEWHGFLCGYTYLFSNLFFFPSLALAIGSIAARLAGVELGTASSLAAALGLIWLATAVAVVGGRIGRWAGNAAAMGTVATAAGLLAVGAAALSGPGPATVEIALRFDPASLNLWSQLAFAYVGLELGAILAGEIRDPHRTVPRAAAIGAVMVAGFYIAGTLAILVLLPPEKVSPVTGLADVFAAAGARFEQSWLGPTAGALVVLAMMGQLGAWINGNGRLPFVIGIDRYFPAVLGRVHPRFGTPWVALLAQGVLSSLCGLALAAGESVRNAYQTLVDMSVLLAFLPYVYIFAGAWKLGGRLAPACGMAVTLGAIVLSMIPPEGAHSVWLFEAKLAGGCLLLTAAARAIFLRKRNAAPFA